MLVNVHLSMWRLHLLCVRACGVCDITCLYVCVCVCVCGGGVPKQASLGGCLVMTLDLAEEGMHAYTLCDHWFT